MNSDTLREMESVLRSISAKADSLGELSAQIKAAEQKRLDMLKRSKKRSQCLLVFSIVAVIIVLCLLINGKILAAIIIAAVAGVFIRFNEKIIPLMLYELGELAYIFGGNKTAIKTFGYLDEYNDSRERVQHCYYELAEEMITNRDYGAAAETFTKAGNYSDAEKRAKEAYYKYAEMWMQHNRYDFAYNAFVNAGDYGDASERILTLQEKNTEGLIKKGRFIDYHNAWYTNAVNEDHSDALKTAWSIRYKYLKYGSIAAGYGFSLGLKADGTIAYAGKRDNGIAEAVGKWTGVVAIFASSDCAVALKADGTVVAAGVSKQTAEAMSEWYSVVSVALEGNWIAALRDDGTLYISDTFNDDERRTLESWTDIIDIAASRSFWVGLARNGTVRAMPGSGYDGNSLYKDMPKWDQIRWLFSTYNSVVGYGVGYHIAGPKYGSITEKMIKINSVSGEGERMIGVKEDETVVVDGEYGTIKRWSGVIVTASSINHTIALKSDGTVFADGNNDYGQCDVSGFVNIGCKQTLQ